MSVPEPKKVFDLLENASRYFSILIRRFPEHKNWVSKKLFHRFTAVDLYRALSEQLSSVPEKKLWEQLSKTFRIFKQQHFLRLGARSLLGIDSFQDTVSQLSDIAITLLQIATQRLLEYPKLWISSSDLELWERERTNISLSVIGLGKLGGRELNFVSDIDLLFLYHAKSPMGARVAQALLPRFVQNLSRLFSDIIDGDRVFIVDLRLRPGGKDGELVPSLDYAVHYYLLQGRSWERLALIKATPVAGDIGLGNQFLNEVQPFVFRRFLDFQAIDEIRTLRDQILRETPSEDPSPGYNVKLGKGGIREVEFLVQSLQLIYGGRLKQLREKNTLRCIEFLRGEKLLSERNAEELSRAYIFLRNLEHWIQLQENRQTHLVPKDATLQNMLALTLGFSSSEELLKELRTHTEIVRYHFERLFGMSCEECEPEATNSVNSEDSSFLLWVEEMLGKDLTGEIGNILRKDTTFRISKNPSETRLRQWVQTLTRRPGLCKFLASSKAKENRALEKAIFTVLHIPSMGELITQVPSLIESFSEGNEFFETYHLWKKRAEEIIEGCGTFEEALLWLRRLKNERLLHIALWDVESNPSLGDLEKEISMLADFFVKTTYKLACLQVLKSSPEDYPLIVSAMGKWGSHEMGYRSDLDLVFIYFPQKDKERGQIPEDVTRFIQRFVRLLSMTLQEGPGYEVDMRLRPTGNYGPLVVTYHAWEDYYTERADIWEIASLLRFRPVVGYQKAVYELRERAKHFCFQSHSKEKVLERLCELKTRMEEERTKETDKNIHIKLGKGGLVEVEFWCQATALTERDIVWEHPLAVVNALPTVFKVWQVPEEEQRELLRAFAALRRLEHRFALLGKNVEELTPQDIETLKDLGLWDSNQKYQDWSDIRRARRYIRSRWEKICSITKREHP